MTPVRGAGLSLTKAGTLKPSCPQVSVLAETNLFEMAVLMLAE